MATVGNVIVVRNRTHIVGSKVKSADAYGSIRFIDGGICTHSVAIFAPGVAITGLSSAPVSFQRNIIGRCTCWEFKLAGNDVLNDGFRTQGGGRTAGFDVIADLLEDAIQGRGIASRQVVAGILNHTIVGRNILHEPVGFLWSFTILISRTGCIGTGKNADCIDRSFVRIFCGICIRNCIISYIAAITTILRRFTIGKYDHNPVSIPGLGRFVILIVIFIGIKDAIGHVDTKVNTRSATGCQRFFRSNYIVIAGRGIHILKCRIVMRRCSRIIVILG